MKRIMSLVLVLILVISLVPVPARAAGEKLVALTFDDGPHKTNTPQLLDGLKELGAKVTFFMLGQNAKSYPDIVQRAYDEGHEVANHSWDHPKLTSLGSSGVQSQVTRTNDQLDIACGDGTRYLLRPPYGSHNSTTRKAAGTALITWSVDTNDWKYKNYSHVYNHIVDNASDGAIILCHDIHKTTIPAALDAIRTLQKKGYEFVTVSELFRRKGQTLDDGSYYSKCKSATLYGPVQTPVITYAPEGSAVRVTITSPSGAPVYISSDSSRWTQESQLYTGSFLVYQPTTIRAISAFQLNGGRSGEASVSIQNFYAARPVAWTDGNAVTLSTETKGASIFYTLDGSKPSEGSAKYTSQLYLEPDTLLRAAAGGSYFTMSPERRLYYSANGNMFADVMPDQWYAETMDEAVSQGILAGMGNCIYEPDGKLTRAMAVQMLYRLDDEPSVDGRTNSFMDVKDSDWFAASVEWAYATGVVEGYPDGTFLPNKAITRQEMAEMIAGFLESQGLPLPEGEDCRDNYLDGDQIADWALESFNAVVAAGLMKGDPAGNLTPVATATRAQFATILLRLEDRFTLEQEDEQEIPIIRPTVPPPEPEIM